MKKLMATLDAQTALVTDLNEAVKKALVAGLDTATIASILERLTETVNEAE